MPWKCAVSGGERGRHRRKRARRADGRGLSRFHPRHLASGDGGVCSDTGAGVRRSPSWLETLARYMQVGGPSLGMMLAGAGLFAVLIIISWGLMLA
jgi:hypothetical protein